MAWFDGVVSGVQNAISAVTSKVTGPATAPSISTPPTSGSPLPSKTSTVSGWFSSLGDIISKEAGNLGAQLGKTLGQTITDTRKQVGQSIAQTPLGQQMQADYISSLLQDPTVLIVAIIIGVLIFRGMSR